MQNGGAFAALMKVAAENSRSSNQEASQAAKRREAALKQAREEQEKKERAERERQKQLLLKRNEDARKEEERKRQREEEMKKKRDELAAKREQEAEHSSRNAVASSSREGGSRPKTNSYIVVGGSALTREEKRMAKDPLMAEKLKARNKANASKKRKEGRLPGGAVNADSGSGSHGRVSSPAASHMSARARITGNFAPTLTRLNTEKRDTRSIDEIARDLRRGKIGGPSDKETVLNGDKAHSFGDWFSKKEKGKAVDVTEQPKRRMDLPVGNGRSREVGSPQGPSRLSQHMSSSKSINKKPLPTSSSKAAVPDSQIYKTQQRPAGPGKRSRGRSSSLDSFIEDDEDEDSEEDGRYAKRRHTSHLDNELGESQRDMIWKILGKDRARYAAIDVESDDDMEATGADLEREEKRSYRIAKQEDAEAEAEERRREIEKKRRKAGAATRDVM